MGILWQRSATISLQRHFIMDTWQNWRPQLYLKVRNLFFFNSLFYILMIALSLSETLYYFGILYLSYFVLF